MSSSNVGKIFEQEVKDSISDDILVHRVRDDVSSFSGIRNAKYSNKNPFDYIMWNPLTLTLYALEMKTVKGKSISFERTDEDKGDIHKYQIDGLKKYNRYGGIVCGFIIHFREIETTVFLSIESFEELTSDISKKSFTMSDLDKFHISYIKIPQRRKIKYNHFDMDLFFNETKLHNTEEII